MEGWEKTKGLKDLQRRLLLWIWWQQESSEQVSREKGRIEAAMQVAADIIHATPTLLEDWRESLQGRLAVQWSTEGFLGHAPSPGDSSTISESLRRLQKRGLLRRIRRGRSKYVTHVRLTEIGQAWARRFVDAWFDHLLAEVPLPPGGVPEPPPEFDS